MCHDRVRQAVNQLLPGHTVEFLTDQSSRRSVCLFHIRAPDGGKVRQDLLAFALARVDRLSDAEIRAELLRTLLAPPAGIPFC